MVLMLFLKEHMVQQMVGCEETVIYLISSVFSDATTPCAELPLVLCCISEAEFSPKIVLFVQRGN